MTIKERPLWITAASEQEIMQVEDMEMEIANIEARRAELMFKKMVLTNRLCQRARFRLKQRKARP